MNERIKELAMKADVYADAVCMSTEILPEGQTWTSLRNEKFAELLIRECAEICKKQEYDYWRSPEDQEFTPQDCADAIEQHFGVEE